MNKILRRSLLILCFLSIQIHLAYTQGNSKINTELRWKIDRLSSSLTQNSIHIPVLIKGDLNKIKTAVVRTHSGKYKYGVDNIASVSLPLHEVTLLASNDFVERIEYHNPKSVLLNDVMIINNNIQNIHTGANSTLQQPYKGKDIIVGVIDVGPDWRHPDLQNSDNTTRFKYIWDQKSTSPTNTSYGYGVEWDSANIDNGSLAAAQTIDGTLLESNHGTHVVGTAAGNGNAVGNFGGAAPESDLVFVNIDFNGFLTNFVDGLQYIFQKADQLGKPCVVNSSVGSYFGSHDSKDLYSQMVDNLLTAKSGRALSQAGGNRGTANMHIGHQVDSDTSFTWYKYSNATQNIYINLYADSADFTNIDFALGAIDPNTFTPLGQSNFKNVLNDFNMSSGYDFNIDTIRDNGGNVLGIMRIDIEFYEQLFDVTIQVEVVNTAWYWELFTTGNGYIDGWNSRPNIGNSSMINTGLPNTSVLPRIIHYENPDNTMNIVGYWACSDKVLTVGAYTNKNQYTTFDGSLRTKSATQGALWYNSSKGPSRTGLMKPDLTATGDWVHSCGVLEKLTQWQTTAPHFLAPGGMHYISTGTSMAAPAATGSIALYLEKFPNASCSEIIQQFQSSAKKDGFVLDPTFGGVAPNISWGYGKLDAQQTMLDAVIAQNNIPTLGEWGIFILALLLFGFNIVIVQRQNIKYLAMTNGETLNIPWINWMAFSNILLQKSWLIMIGGIAVVSIAWGEILWQDWIGLTTSTLIICYTWLWIKDKDYTILSNEV